MRPKTVAHFRDLTASIPAVPLLLILVPTLTILAHWLFGDVGLYGAGLGLPLIIAAVAVVTMQTDTPRDASLTPFDVQREKLELAADRILTRTARSSRSTACILLSIDEFTQMRERLGMQAADRIQRRVAERLTVSLRRDDTIGCFNDGVFGIVLSPIARADLETILMITGRLQKALAEPIPLSGTRVHVTVSVGFSQPDRVPDVTGIALVEAAEAALREASSRGPGSVRAYSVELHRRRVAQTQMSEDLRDALEHGQIVPWFQPQVSTDTGQVTGFEALARWNHPDRGMIPPGDFLPVLERSGLMERLSEVILFQSLTAMKAWARAGLHIPTVGVNFSTDELRNPNLVDKIAWELDRFELDPSRLTVEVLENVMASSPDDTISRNITSLANLGCKIDLDDFGTGHASITNIRRFSVSRLKIDRSFVTRVHEDREQQRMVAAILTMAERLELDTLAEGVESVGEHTMLAQLGCGHVQGYGIARPMPFEETIAWIQEYNSKLVQPPVIGRQSSN